MQNDCFILGAPDGTVWKYNLKSGEMDQLLFRCLSPVRDLCLSNDGEWVAVASEYEFVPSRSMWNANRVSLLTVVNLLLGSSVLMT